MKICSTSYGINMQEYVYILRLLCHKFKKNSVLNTSQLLWGDTMTNTTYKGKHLPGELLTVSEVLSKIIMVESKAADRQAQCWRSLRFFWKKPQSHPQGHTFLSKATPPTLSQTVPLPGE